MIQVTELAKSFGATRAVNNVSFAVKPGETLGLLGPNGAGKTSSLRMLCGLLTPDSGSISIDDIDAVANPIGGQKKLGVLPDNCGLYTRLTAAENIRYFAELHGMPQTAIGTRIQALANALDMHDILDRRTHGFSQGERMKVALARALVHEPPYLILDEPTNGLDVLTTRAVRQLLLNLKSQGVGIIFSSHLMHEVTHLCDQIAIVLNGTIAARGTPASIIDQANACDLEEAFAHFCSQGATHE